MEGHMLYEILPDPRALYPKGEGAVQTLQIHRPIPERVPIGRFEHSADGVAEVIDEVVSRSEYLHLIQRACAELGDGLTIRFYDHFEVGFDASVLDHLDEIRRLSIDGMKQVHHPQAVGRLPKLTDLLFGPWGKHKPDVLAALGVQRLEHFTLARTLTPPIDLSPIGEARSLRTLRLLGRGKNTESIRDCTSLTELAIEPSPKFSLDFINQLNSLETLKFVLGRTTSIAAIGSLPSLRDLSLFEVHLLEDLGDLQRFPRLWRLQLSDQPRIAELHVGSSNAALEHMRLYSVPALHTIKGLSSLPALKSLWAYDSRLDIPWSALPPTLTHFQLVTKRVKGRDQHNAEVRSRGLIPDVHVESHFFYK
jgi:hypothetical protein